MGGCQSRVKNRAKLLARQEQNELQHGPCRQLPHPVWGAFRFQRMELLGRGAGGVTYLCRCLDTDEAVAVKMIKRPIPMMLGHLMLREIMIQAELGAGHINIVGVKEVILTDTHLGIVMECASGGNLARYLMDKMRRHGSTQGLLLDEAEASYLFRQLVSAVEFCHDNCIAHRDIKLDNTLLDHNSPPTLKLCDFGLSRCWGDEGPEMHTVAGTPCYMSPQLTSHHLTGYRHPGYDATKSDVWSMAVVLFVMLLGRFPFDGEGSKGSHKETLQLVHSQQQAVKSWREIPFVARYVACMSPELLDLLDGMFEFDSTKRISVAEICNHAWCTQPLPPRMQTSWDRMQRLQLARRLNFFPARSHARSNSCPPHALVLNGMQQDCVRHSSHVCLGMKHMPDLQQRSCHPALPTGATHGTSQSEEGSARFATEQCIQKRCKSRICEEPCSRPRSADERRHTLDVDALSEHSTCEAMAGSHGCSAAVGKRCHCYDSWNVTPEQCAEELQQLLTQASLPAPYQDPDAVLSRMQLVKVLCHVPCHKIPSISYFKESSKVPRKTLGNPAHSTSNKSIPSIIGTQIFPDVSPRTPNISSSIIATSQPAAQSPSPMKHSPLSAAPPPTGKPTWEASSSSPSESTISEHSGLADDEHALSSSSICSSEPEKPAVYQSAFCQVAEPAELLNNTHSLPFAAVAEVAMPGPISARGIGGSHLGCSDIRAGRDQLFEDAALSSCPDACRNDIQVPPGSLKLPDILPDLSASHTSAFTICSPSPSMPAGEATVLLCHEHAQHRKVKSTTFESVSCSAVCVDGAGTDDVMCRTELQDMITSLSMRPCGVRDIHYNSIRELSATSVPGCATSC